MCRAVHSFKGAEVGGHGFSANGVEWTFGDKANGFLQDGAYTLDVQVAQRGRHHSDVVTVVTLARRERPHLLLDQAGNPSVLTNGVQPAGTGTDWTYTGAFPVRATARKPAADSFI